MKYQPVIGLEVHAELSTKSKIYCSCSTSFGAPINTHTCPVCTGMPGALPVLNKQVVHYAAKMGLATGCTVNQLCKADRKNYFYPDLPKAYQISQFDVPICENGEVFFYVDGEKKSCRLERIHFEEDAGKLLHDEIDQAERLFQRVLTAEYIESTTDYRIDCSELLTQLHHLPDLQRPSLKNLF